MITASMLKEGTYFTVPDSRNVYIVTFRTADGTGRIHAAIQCRHTIDAEALMILHKDTEVVTLSLEDQVKHLLHPSWVLHEEGGKGVKFSKILSVACAILLVVTVMIQFSNDRLFTEPWTTLAVMMGIFVLALLAAGVYIYKVVRRRKR